MGWNGSGGDTATKTAQPKKGGASSLHGLIALLLVVAIGGVVYWLVSKPAAKPTKPAEEEPTTETAIEVVTPEIAEAPEPAVEEKKEEVKKVDPAKAARAAKLRAMTPAERMEFLFEEAKQKPIDFTTTTNRPFATGTEQVMSWIFNARVGDMPPPMPRLPIRDEAHMAEILMANNPALEGDSEKVKAAKAMVERAKDACIEYVKEGGDVTEFLEYYRGQLVEAHEEWQAAQKSVMQVLREDPEIAAEFITEVNAHLEEKGIKPVNIPPRMREQLGL